MKRLFSLQQILAVLLTGIILLSSTGANALETIQPSPTAVTTSLQVADMGHLLAASDDNRNNVVGSQQKVKGAADNVREKLNLDQPLYPPTKEFLDSAQKSPQRALQKTEEAIEGASNSAKGNRSM